MSRILKKTISCVLALAIVFCIPGFTFTVEAARASDIALDGVTLSREQLKHICEKKLDSGEIIDYEFTYYDYIAQLNNPSVRGVTDYFDNMKQSHPRLLIDDFGNLLDKIDNDYICAINYAGLKTEADKLLTTAPYSFYLNQRDNINNFSSNIESRVIVLSFVYNIEREKTELGRADAATDYVKYAKRAVEELRAAAQYPHWSVNAFLCTAEVAVAFAFGYDWLYYYLSKSDNLADKEMIEDAVYKHAIVPFLYNYIVDKTGGTDFAYTGMNWNPVCNGSAIVIGMAFYDKGDITGKFSAICQYLTERGAEAMWNGMGQYADGGFYREGSSYWTYATQYMVCAVAAYEFAANPGYTLPERYQHILAPGVSETPDFPIYMNGITSTFDFGDCSNALQLNPAVIWIGNRFNKQQYAAYYNTIKMLYDKSYGGKASAYTILWYQPGSATLDVLDQLPLDMAHVSETDVNILSLRSEFEVNTSSTSSAFVAMQGGQNLANHMGTHLGTFVLDMNGKRFVKQLPNGNYAWSGYNGTNSKYKWYVRRAEGNNTMVFDPQDAANSNDQSAKAFAKIIESGTCDDTGYGIVDLTSTNAKLKKWHRGIMLTDNRRRVVVQDEIEAASEIRDAYWFAHIGTVEYVIEEGAKSVLLTSGSRSIRATITSGSGVFEVVDAKPLPTSPNPVEQQSKDYGKKMRIHLTNVTNETLRVEFAPADASDILDVVELAKWKGEILQDSVVEAPNYLNANHFETDWYAPEFETYYIHDDRDLAGLAYMVNNGNDFAGKTVKLVNDISIDSELQWVPIGNVEKPFKGVFDGSQKKVIGAGIADENALMVGLFGLTEEAEIKNLEISGFDFTAKGDAGALIARAFNTKISNVFVDNTTLRADKRLGGIVGVQYNGYILNSGVNAKVFGTNTMYGGVVGYATGVVDNCVANVMLSENVDGNGEGVILGTNRGGIAGISACGDIRNSYYNYSVKASGRGVQPIGDASVNLSNTLGKINAELVVSSIGSTNSQLGYLGNGNLLNNVANFWITAQDNHEDYITWVAAEGNIGKYAKLTFEPETVIDLNFNKPIFEISDVDSRDGKLSFVIKNQMIQFVNNGYLIVTQRAEDGSTNIKLLALDLKAGEKRPIQIDAIDAQDTKIFVVDSFLNMMIKSNTIDL